MPVHRNVLVHVEEAAARRDIERAHVELARQGQVVGQAAQIADIGEDVGVVVNIGAGEGLTRLRAVGILDRADFFAIHDRTYDTAGARDVEERRGKAAADLRPAHVVVNGDAIVEFIVELAAQGGLLGGDPAHRHPFQIARAIHDQEVLVVDRIVRAVATVETGERLDVADLVAAERGKRGGAGVVRLLRVGHLEQQAEVALTFAEFLGQVALDLDRIRNVVIGVKRTTARFELTADVEAKRFVDRAAITEIDLGFVEVHALGKRNETAVLFTGVADVVDHRARCLRGIGGRTAAAHRFHALDAGIEAGPVVVVAELDVAEQHGRQAIFLDLHEGRTARSNRKTANGDVRVTARTGRTRHLDTRDHAEDFRFGTGLEGIDQIGTDAGDRDGAVQPALVAARRGDDDFIETADLIVSSRCVLRESRHGNQAHHRDRRGRDTALQNGLVHSLSPRDDRNRLPSSKSRSLTYNCNNRLQRDSCNRLLKTPTCDESATVGLGEISRLIGFAIVIRPRYRLGAQGEMTGSALQ